MRGATMLAGGLSVAVKFQSTRPMRGATIARPTRSLPHGDFNPRAPCGARPIVFPPLSQTGGISIHAPHAGRDRRAPSAYAGRAISIHAPHAGRDDPALKLILETIQISIHAPHAGRDWAPWNLLSLSAEFQSTRPMRGATSGRNYLDLQGHHFNPRAPCGARPGHFLQQARN